MLINLLNDMRQGVVSEGSERLLRSLSREIEHDSGTQPVELFPHRERAEAANNAQMSRLSGPALTFNATDKPGVDTEGKPVNMSYMTDILDRMVAPKLKLRVSVPLGIYRKLN